MLLLLFVFSIDEGIEGKPLDSLEVQRNQNTSFWEKLSFGIGYSGGLCWTGEDLEKANAQPLDVSAKFYWLNIIEGQFQYPINKSHRLVMKINYIWTELQDRYGFFTYIYNYRNSGNDALLSGGTHQRLSSATVSLGLIRYLEKDNGKRFFYIGLAGGWGESETNETRAWGEDPYYSPIEKAKVIRKHAGLLLEGGIGISKNITSKSSLIFELLLQGGGLMEYDNNSPWKDGWEEKGNRLFWPMNCIKIKICFLIGEEV